MKKAKYFQLEKKWRSLRSQWTSWHRQQGNKDQLDNLAIEIDRVWSQLEATGKSFSILNN